MTDGVEVKLGANTSQATSGISSAVSEIEASLAGLRGALAGFAAKSAETSAAVVGHTKKISSSINSMGENVRVRLGSVNSAFLQLRSNLLAFGAVFAGGILFKDSIGAMLNEEGAVRRLEISFGMTAEAATRLHIALDLAGISTERYVSMAMRVQMMLKNQPQIFERLGIAVKDSNGAYLGTDQILQNVYKRMQDFKAGTDQNMVALATIGRSAAGFAEDMSRLNAVTERAGELQQQLGIEMGDAQQAKVERYRIEVNSFRVALEQVGAKIGETVIPSLESLASFFSSRGPSAAKFMVNAVREAITVIDNFAVAVQEMLVLVSGYWNALRDRAAELMTGLKLLFSDGWSAMRTYVEAENKRILANVLKTNQEALGIEADYQRRMAALWGDQDASKGVNAVKPKSGTETAPDLRPGRGGGKGGSDMQGWEEQLKEQQDAYDREQAAQGSMQTWSIAQTRDYWEEILSITDLSAKDRQAAQAKYYEADLKLLQNSAKAKYKATMDELNAEIKAQGHNIEQKIALAQEELQVAIQGYGQESEQAKAAYRKIEQYRADLKTQKINIAREEQRQEEDIQKHAYDMARQNADFEVSMRRMSADQRIAIERQFLDQEFQANIQAREKQIAAMKGDPNADPVALAKLEEQLLKVRQDYETRTTQLVQQAELQRAQVSIQATQSVQNAFATFFASVADGTKSLKSAFTDMVKSIEQQLSQLAANQLAKQLFGAGTSGGNILQSFFGNMFGGSGNSGDAASLTAAGTSLNTAGGLLTSAAAQLQAAVASMSLGGGMFGAGGGLFGGMGSFFGFPGFAVGTPYVPQDMLAMIHKGEAIIPASMNKVGAMTGGGMTVSQHFHLTGPVDTRSQGQLAAAAYRGIMGAQRRHV